MNQTLKHREKIAFKGRTLTVTELDLDSLPKVREFLISAARRGQTATYGELRSKAQLPHPTQGLGRLLDLLTVDCTRRGEPDLAALVVNASTLEVGSQYGQDAEQHRQAVHAYWARDLADTP